MQLKNLFTDDEAVSPVIGVILMVAITVILAAVIGAFVLGIGSSQEKAPQASIAFDWSGSTTVEFNHDGGETLQANSLDVSSTGSISSCSITASDGIDAGEKIGDCDQGNSGDTVTITWNAESGDSSQILKESTQP